FNVRVLGALGASQNVLTDLLSARATVTRPQDGIALDAAILSLSNSLAPGLWTDETHLNQSRGQEAFQREKDAVTKLLSPQVGGISASELQSMLDRILKSSRLLAVVAIRDATKAGAAQRKMVQANQDLIQGDS